MDITVNNINLHYEVYGEGKPIILLHGNQESHDTFDKLIPKLEESFKVYALDSRCHGKSDDPKEISYDLMCQDVIEFITKLNIEKPILYGFSDGGIIGLLIAINRPELLSKLIISGAQLNPEGADLKTIILDKVTYFFTRNKLVKMMVKEPNIKVEDLRKITIPVHVLAGEKDLIRYEHSKTISDNIENSTLEIIPNENHGSYVVHNEKLFEILNKYLFEW